MADKFPALTGRASDTQLLDHLQWLIEQRGEHGSTSAISLGYEENGPRIELYHGEKQWFATWRADGSSTSHSTTSRPIGRWLRSTSTTRTCVLPSALTSTHL